MFLESLASFVEKRCHPRAKKKKRAAIRALLSRCFCCPAFALFLKFMMVPFFYLLVFFFFLVRIKKIKRNEIQR